jgi:hypothetical protein
MTYEQLKQEAMEYLAKVLKGQITEVAPCVVQAAVTLALSRE